MNALTSSRVELPGEKHARRPQNLISSTQLLDLTTQAGELLALARATTKVIAATHAVVEYAERTTVTASTRRRTRPIKCQTTPPSSLAYLIS